MRHTRKCFRYFVSGRLFSRFPLFAAQRSALRQLSQLSLCPADIFVLSVASLIASACDSTINAAWSFGCWCVISVISPPQQHTASDTDYSSQQLSSACMVNGIAF